MLDEYRRELVERYRRQPAAYRERLKALDEAALHSPIKPGEWSAHQVIFHVSAVDEQAYGPRLLRILREDRPELEDFDSDRWMADHYGPGEPSQVILDRWQSARQAYADEVAAAPREAWSRTGRQPYWGERTLQWWVERAVAHAEEHQRQLEGE